MKILILVITCLCYSLVSNAAPSSSSSLKNLHQYAVSIGNENFNNRVLSFSKYFLSKPYDTEIGNNLIIWDQTRNKINLINLESFDCFSYIEMVLALSKIQTPNPNLEEFTNQLADNLATIMFSSDNIDYASRNHFMDEWLRNNKNIIGENVFAKLNYSKLKSAKINKAGLLKNQIKNYADKTLNESQCQQFIDKYNNLVNNSTPYESSIKYISFSDFLLHQKELTQDLQEKIYIITIIMDNPKLLELTGSEHNIAHVGFVFAKAGQLYLRHATSVGSKSVEEISLIDYVNAKKQSKVLIGFTLFNLKNSTQL